MTPEEKCEFEACNPPFVKIDNFNSNAAIPYGVTINHICAAMNDFIHFLQMVNTRLYENGSPRLETMLMSANFSSIVGEFIIANLPKHSCGIVKNRYHNGHPDILPAGRFPNNSQQYCHDGIEVKASRYLKSWQGHNAEESWLMVIIFEANRTTDEFNGIKPIPFRFLRVVGAQLSKNDWKFAGRSEQSRRTITASVTASGYKKMMANWIYNTPELAL